jgi:glycosyltransferase involved in cell wall biosynthesis
MRVIHVLPALANRYGGPAVSAVECSLALRDRDIAASIVSTDIAGPPSKRPLRVSSELELPDGAEHLEVHLCKSSWPYRLAYSRELSDTLKREVLGANVVRIHSLFLFPQYAAFRQAIRADVPYIVSFHGAMDPYLRRRGRLRKWLTDVTWQGDMLQRAAAIHVTTDDERELTACIAPAVPRVIASNGISWHRFQDLPDGSRFRSTLLDGHDGPIVLSLGRIARKKAPERLIRALPDVLAQDSNTLLVFAGPDDEGLADGLRRLARSLEIESSVRFVGMLHRDERLHALGAATIWALPSHTENFAVAAAEAMAAGLPVILTPQVNIAREAATAGAAVMTRPDAADLAEQLIRLLDDSTERQRLGMRAREYAKRYDWARVAAEYAQMYSDVIQGHRDNRAAA